MAVTPIYGVAKGHDRRCFCNNTRRSPSNYYSPPRLTMMWWENGDRPGVMQT